MDAFDEEDIPFEGDDDLIRGRARRALDCEVARQLGEGRTITEARLRFFVFIGMANLDISDEELADHAQQFVADFIEMDAARDRHHARERKAAANQLARYGSLPIGPRYEPGARVRIGEGKVGHIAEHAGHWNSHLGPGDVACGAQGFARPAAGSAQVCRACQRVKNSPE